MMNCNVDLPDGAAKEESGQNVIPAPKAEVRTLYPEDTSEPKVSAKVSW